MKAASPTMSWFASPPPSPPPPDLPYEIVGAVLILIITFLIISKITAPRPLPAGKITGVVVYPLKSARGVNVRRASLDTRGLVYDRLWMAVDARGSFLSQRRAPKLALVEPELPSSADAPLRLRFPGAKALEVPVVRDGPPTRVRVWDDHCDGIDQGDAAANWLSAVLEVEGARLVRMKEGARRPCDARYAPRGSLTAYSDGFPLLLASEASLGALNERIAARGRGKKVPMDRFRPNLIVGDRFGDRDHRSGGAGGGLAPFAEDGWASIRVGGGGLSPALVFGVVKPCARCKIPTIDQKTGVPDGAAGGGRADFSDDEGGGPAAEAEPTATLRTFRTGSLLGYRKKGWAKDVFFAQNLTIAAAPPGGVVAVGDVVVATPRRRPSWLAWGVRGVDYA